VTETARPIAIVRAQLEGALDALTTLHEDLILRRDEAQNESAREAYDEVLTLLDSLQSEYRRRHHALPPVSARHASYVFLLDQQGQAHPLPHALYVSLVRGAATAPEFADQTLRLAEWYVRLKEDEPESVVNEHYGFLAFDGDGRVDWPATPRDDKTALPTSAEWEQIRTQLFTATKEPPAT
jgi:hypothetical protein